MFYKTKDNFEKKYFNYDRDSLTIVMFYLENVRWECK